MGRKKKSTSQSQPASERIVVMTFADGPRAGGTIKIANPPPRYIKTAFPTWAVYENTNGEYRVTLQGELALRWRNPVRSDFFA